MSEMTVSISLAVTFAILLVWLLRPRRHTVEPNGTTTTRPLESSLPKHYRFFPQIRQALSDRDNQYLRETVPPHIARQVLRERRAIARRFLSGLREDFSSLERVARMVASLSPEVSRQKETERLLLGLKFRFLYGLVWLHLSTGGLPLRQMEQMTGLIGRLALRMEQAMTEITALSMDRIPRGLNA